MYNNLELIDLIFILQIGFKKFVHLAHPILLAVLKQTFPIYRLFNYFIKLISGFKTLFYNNVYRNCFLITANRNFFLHLETNNSQETVEIHCPYETHTIGP